MTAIPAPAKFTRTDAIRLAAMAAAEAGLVAGPAELIRLGSNAVVRLPDAVIARIAPDESWTQVATREVNVANALHRSGVPCVRPLPIVQPVVADGHPVTFWVEVPGPLADSTPADLGAVLRLLHGARPDVQPPALNPWGRMAERIEQVPVAAPHRQVLRDALARVQDEWAAVRFVLDPGVIHGDAYVGNVIRGADDSVLLLDFDSVCTGPREWDLVPTGLYATSLGWITAADYGSFVAAYGGFDVTRCPAFPVLARIRELRMTSWLAMYATESERVAAEVAHRVTCIADPALPRHWSAR